VAMYYEVFRCMNYMYWQKRFTLYANSFLVSYAWYPWQVHEHFNRDFIKAFLNALEASEFIRDSDYYLGCLGEPPQNWSHLFLENTDVKDFYEQFFFDYYH
jgi:hypothetical protein